MAGIIEEVLRDIPDKDKRTTELEQIRDWVMEIQRRRLEASRKEFIGRGSIRVEASHGRD